MLCHVLFLLFKQKTAYEMRISDWSSDVCSSDLSLLPRREVPSSGFGFGASTTVDIAPAVAAQAIDARRISLGRQAAQQPGNQALDGSGHRTILDPSVHAYASPGRFMPTCGRLAPGTEGQDPHCAGEWGRGCSGSRSAEHTAA